MRLEDEISQKKFKSDYHKALVNVIYTNNWLINLQSGLFKKHGLTTQQYNILRILRGKYPAPASIKTIRARMLDKMSDASRIVEKLRVKGWVIREVSESDRRNVDVVISPKGLEILEKMDPFMDQALDSLKNLDEAEIFQLNQLLDKLRG
jgi:DNA-binding MarR family transcriptional regulator